MFNLSSKCYSALVPSTIYTVQSLDLDDCQHNRKAIQMSTVPRMGYAVHHVGITDGARVGGLGTRFSEGCCDLGDGFRDSSGQVQGNPT